MSATGAAEVRGRLTPEALTAQVRSGAIDTVLVVFPDMQGRLVGKRVTGTYFVDNVLTGTIEVCNYLLAVDVDMNPLPGYTFANWTVNGNVVSLSATYDFTLSSNLNLVAKQIKLKLMPDAAKYILDKTLVDRSYGARPLRRALQKYIEDPLSEALIQGNLQRPAEYEVYLGETGIFCRLIQAEGEVAVGAGAETETVTVTTPAISLYPF